MIIIVENARAVHLTIEAIEVNSGTEIIRVCGRTTIVEISPFSVRSKRAAVNGTAISQ